MSLQPEGEEEKGQIKGLEDAVTQLVTNHNSTDANCSKFCAFFRQTGTHKK